MNLKEGKGILDRAKYYQGKFRAADKVTVLYQLIISAIIVFNFSKVPNARLFISLHLVVMTFILVLPFLGSNKLLNWLRTWNQIIIVPLNFFELHYLVHNVRPIDMDGWLIKIDRAIFGLDPTVWLEKIQLPVLTEYLQLIYVTFYFLPLILAFLLYRRSRMEEFDYFAFIIVFGFYASYLLYFVVPAVGPRFTLTELHSQPLKGLWLTPHIQHTLNTLENIQRDAFPSGHTAMTLLTMVFAYKYHRKYFYVLLIIGTSLIFSTVYLRYHYVIDVIAGFLLAWFVVVAGPVFYRALNVLPFLAPERLIRHVVRE